MIVIGRDATSVTEKRVGTRMTDGKERYNNQVQPIQKLLHGFQSADVMHYGWLLSEVDEPYLPSVIGRFMAD